MKMFSKNSNSSNSEVLYDEKNQENLSNLPVNRLLSINLNILHDIFTSCADVTFREFSPKVLGCTAVIVFINGLVDSWLVNENIVSSLMESNEESLENLIHEKAIETVRQNIIKIAATYEISTIREITDAVLNGYTVFLADGSDKAIKIRTMKVKDRGVSQPTIEKTIRGPMDAFTENIYTNAALLRRKIKSTQLKFEEYTLGRQTQTSIYIAYQKGIVDENILKEAKDRISRIDVDSILGSGYIEEFIEDTSYTLFPQIQHTERPDKVAASILEGRIAILVDGTPFTLILPATMTQFLQANEDYYERYIITSFIRLLRYFFFGISLILPGAYVAIVSYHKEMIPTPLLISILNSSKDVPFPVLIEALIMEVTFEALREAGIRLPLPASQTVGIVGVLVIGDAAVKAGIVSSIMVIIISVTAVASFSIPSYDLGYSIRILRFSMLFLGSFLGFYGITLGILVILIHLASLRSFGIDYLYPIAPLNLKGLKDTVARFPWWAMDERPDSTSPNNRYRQKQSLRPKPPKNGSNN